MATYATQIEEAIKEISKLPGIGKKSALRIVNHLLNGDSLEIEKLSRAILMLKDKIEKCPECHGFKEKESDCPICCDPKRDKKTICVVESTSDMHLIDMAANLRCAYFVLSSLLSPAKGITADKLKLDDLLNVVEKNSAKEVIIATPYTAEGEATASYIINILKEKEVKISRIGMGIPIGSELSYIDSETLSRALNFRREIK